MSTVLPYTTTDSGKSRSLPARAPATPIEFFSLAVQYAKERGLRSIPLPIDYAEAILALVSPNKHDESNGTPPPMEVTSVTYEEERRRTNPLRPSGPFSRPLSLKDAGRGWHRGM